MSTRMGAALLLGGAVLQGAAAPEAQARTHKPALHGRHWMAVTGKPLAATAGARIFQQGGNAVDAACAMIAATSTMWDTLSWGGETQALIYNPNTGKVIGINGLGVAPTGATPEYFHKLGMKYPPQYGPLAAVTPGTPGGLMTMLADMKSSLESGRVGEAVRTIDPLPPSLYRVLEKAGQVASNVRSAEKFLSYPGAREISEHPKVVALRNDSRVMELIASGHIFELMKNPRMIETMNDPALQARVKKFDLERALDYALKKN